MDERCHPVTSRPLAASARFMSASIAGKTRQPFFCCHGESPLSPKCYDDAEHLRRPIVLTKAYKDCTSHSFFGPAVIFVDSGDQETTQSACLSLCVLLCSECDAPLTRRSTSST